MIEEQFTIKIVMNGGSAGIRSYLEDHGFDVYRNSLISNRFEHVRTVKLDENGNIDDGATFTAIWNGKQPHEEERYILDKVRKHPSVNKLTIYFKRVEIRRYTDEVPG